MKNVLKKHSGSKLMEADLELQIFIAMLLIIISKMKEVVIIISNRNIFIKVFLFL